MFRNRSTSINQTYEDKLPKLKDRFEPQTFDDRISELDHGSNKIAGLQTVISKELKEIKSLKIKDGAHIHLNKAIVDNYKGPARKYSFNVYRAKTLKNVIEQRPFQKPKRYPNANEVIEEIKQL